MSKAQADDLCPYCRRSLEIVYVKFRFSSVDMITACPNCAIASVKECSSAGSKFLTALARPLMRTGPYALRLPSPADPEGGKPVSATGDDPSRKIV
jgi:hypothetical protein